MLGAAILIAGLVTITALAKSDSHMKRHAVRHHPSLQSVGYLKTKADALSRLSHSTRRAVKHGPTGPRGPKGNAISAAGARALAKQQAEASGAERLSVHPNTSCAVPDAPGSPAATGGANQAGVTWTTPGNNGATITGYLVTAVNGSANQNAQDQPAAATSATLTGIAGGSYTFTIVAQSSCGNSAAATTPAATVTGSSTYASTVISDSPAAYFRLGEPTGTTMAADSSGHGLVGTYNTGGITLGSTGALPSDTGATSVFDNNGTWIAQVPQPNGLPVGNAARTVQAWVKPNDANCRWVLGYGVNGTDNGYSLAECPNSVQIDGYNDLLNFSTTEPLTDGAWHLITVTYDGNNVTAYEDGRSLGTKQFANALSTSAGTLELGAYESQCCNNWAFGGVQDEAVYPSALTATQISNLVKASGYGVPTAPGSPTATGSTNTATVHWTAATAPGTTVTGYIVTAKLGTSAVQSIAAPGTATSAKLSGLKTGSYTFSIVAVDAYGTGAAATTTPATSITSTATTYSSVVFGDHPAVFYRLDEATGSTLAADSSGHSLTGAYASNCLTLGVAGPLANDTATAASSSACNNIASVNYSAKLPAGTSARTVQAWIKPSDANCRYFMGYGTNAITDGSFSVGNCGNSVIVKLINDDHSFFSPRSLADGHWHLVTVTDTYAAATGNKITAYVDGQNLGTDISNPLQTPANTGLTIGSTPSDCCYFGAVADAAVYPTALSAAQITALLTAGGNGVPTAPTGVSATPSANTAVVKWTASTAPGTTVSNYVVTAMLGSKAEQSISTTSTTATLHSLPSGSYTFKVVAYDTFGAGPAGTSSGSTAVTGNASTYASTILGAKPALYFRLDDASGPMAADSSGNGTHGFYETSGVTHGVTGALHESTADLGATQTNVPFLAEAGGSTLTPSGDSNRTLEAWIKPADTSCRYFAGTGSTGTDQGFSLEECPNQVIVDASNDARSFQTPRPLNDGSWHFIAATYNDTGGVDQVTAYLDGVSLGTKSFAGGSLITPVQSTLWLGAGAGDCCTAFNGSLDEVAVFPSALTATAIAGQFTASGQGAPAAPTGVSATIGTNSATVKWTAATAPTPVTAYVVSAFNGTHQESAIATSSTARSAILNGLRGGTPYTFHVVAYNGYGPGPAGVSAAATPTGAATTYSSAVIGDNPVAYYKLAELSGAPYAAESSGNGTLATYNASVTSFGNAPAVPNDGAKTVSSNSNDAIAFDGTLPGSNLPVANNPRTIVMWTKLGDGNCRYAMGYGNNSTNQGFGVVVCPNSVQVAGINDSAIFGTTHTLSDGNWHQIAVTFDGTNIVAYADGVNLGTQQFSATINTPVGTTLYLGAGPGDAGGRWLGGLADVAIYPTALSASQIGGLFSASGYGVPTTPTGVSAAGGANQATVQWTDSSAPNTSVTGYVVTALVGGTTPANSVATNGGSASATITGLKGGTAYTFQVQAVDPYGTSAAATSSSVTPTGSANTFASDILADGPAAYYRLGEQTGSIAADSSGNGVLANYNTSVVSLGQSPAFPTDSNTSITTNGSNYAAYVPDGTTNVLPTGASARSVALWVKPGDTGCDRYLVAWGVNTSEQGFGVGECPSSIRVDVWNEPIDFSTGGINMDDGNWHFVVVSVDASGDATVYVDNTNLGTSTFGTTLNTAPNTGLIIGKDAEFTNSPVFGGLQDVAVFPTALTSAQVSTLWVAR